MHLPKCDSPARSLRLTLKDVFSECRSTGFTGALVFTAGDLKGAVLFRAGTPICAENGSLAGKQALREIEASTTIVRADFHTFPADDLETVVLFNESTKVGDDEGDGMGRTTIKPVNTGHATRTASIRVIGADTSERSFECQVQIHRNTGGSEKKQVLNPSSIEALKKLSENFEASASDLLKEMHLEHLIVSDKKEER
ncbi:MAG: hypothetical protein PWP08_1120 [Methanofollis sp.]|nr:hypothetical protein [Methanofollis sp.]